jgi:hypothetical protein
LIQVQKQPQQQEISAKFNVPSIESESAKQFEQSDFPDVNQIMSVSNSSQMASWEL